MQVFALDLTGREYLKYCEKRENCHSCPFISDKNSTKTELKLECIIRRIIELAGREIELHPDLQHKQKKYITSPLFSEIR